MSEHEILEQYTSLLNKLNNKIDILNNHIFAIKEQINLIIEHHSSNNQSLISSLTESLNYCEISHEHDLYISSFINSLLDIGPINNEHQRLNENLVKLNDELIICYEARKEYVAFINRFFNPQSADYDNDKNLSNFHFVNENPTTIHQPPTEQYI